MMVKPISDKPLTPVQVITHTEVRGPLNYYIGLENALAIEEALKKAGFTFAQGWQPIETAPKDGTDFLALCPFQKKHHQMVGCFAPDGYFHSWPGRWKYEPTHWQPLPEPPPQEDRKD